MTAEDDFLDLTDKMGIKRTLENPSIVPENSGDRQKNGFDFRPLTEEQKKQFSDSLEAKGRLADKVVRFGGSAA